MGDRESSSPAPRDVSQWEATSRMSPGYWKIFFFFSWATRAWSTRCCRLTRASSLSISRMRP